MKLFKTPTKRIITPLSTDEDGEPTIRFRTDLYIKKGYPINYVIQLELRISKFLKRWKPIIRYNFSKGIAHRDIYSLDGKKFKDDLGKFKNLKVAVNYAINDIKENWQRYIKSFKSGRKWKP